MGTGDLARYLVPRGVDVTEGHWARMAYLVRRFGFNLAVFFSNTTMIQRTLLVDFMKHTSPQAFKPIDIPSPDAEEGEPEPGQQLEARAPSPEGANDPQAQAPDDLNENIIRGRYTMYQFWNFVDDELERLRQAAQGEVGNCQAQMEVWIAT